MLPLHATSVVIQTVRDSGERPGRSSTATHAESEFLIAGRNAPAKFTRLLPRNDPSKFPVGGLAIFWHETFLRPGTPQPLPSRTEVERRLRAFAPQKRDGGRGRPPFWPAGDPVAQSVACVRPVVSPPVRRPDVRGCSPPSVVGRQFRRFGRACQAPALKPAAQGRTASMGSARSSALSGRRGSGEIRFMVGGERQKADHVGFFTGNGRSGTRARAKTKLLGHIPRGRGSSFHSVLLQGFLSADPD